MRNHTKLQEQKTASNAKTEQNHVDLTNEEELVLVMKLILSVHQMMTGMTQIMGAVSLQ